MANRLIHETSPYLLQHAHNPVDWYAWGEEALERARREGKPILLSIGYAACHWCHVMEHESFEDQEIARQMNERFVCIKVDREERPDLDGIYMQAVQALTGHGGWPMTVFLTPDGRPFYGGTYFPPEDRHGMPGFPRVLDAVTDTYNNRRGDVLHAAETLTTRLQEASRAHASAELLEASLLRQAHQGLASFHDPTHGGFGGAPKFPQPMTLEFLLRYHHRTGEAQALHMVEQTLESMAFGGIYDQIGGGFHRYATDSHWLVPHFEKMLYDNALLVQLYLHGYQLTGKPLYRRVAEETLDYLLREMRDAAGGFHASEDADSEGVEGKYYVWSPQEIEAALGAEDAALFNEHYGVTQEGNFEGLSILSVPMPSETVAQAVGMSEEELLAKLEPMKERLRELRDKRVHPARDDKVLTAWNAMALRALAQAASVLESDTYRQAAEASGAFLLEQLRRDGRLLRTWRDGRAHLKAYLEDYALLILGLLALHEATFSHRWLRSAKELTDEMLSLFWSDQQQTLFDTGADHEALVVRPRDITDNAVPSGSSAAAEALLLMGMATGDSEYTRRGALLLRSVRDFMAQHPTGFGHWLCALDLYLATSTEVAVVGDPKAPATKSLLQAVHGSYLPNRVLLARNPSDDVLFDTPVLEGRTAVDDRPTAYVCHQYVCELPTSDPEALKAQLAG